MRSVYSARYNTLIVPARTPKRETLSLPSFYRPSWTCPRITSRENRERMALNNDNFPAFRRQCLRIRDTTKCILRIERATRCENQVVLEGENQKAICVIRKKKKEFRLLLLNLTCRSCLYRLCEHSNYNITLFPARLSISFSINKRKHD